MKQPIHRTVIDGVSNALFKRAPDLPHRRDLPTLSLREKGGEEFLRFFQSEILPSPPSFSRRFNGRNAEAIVAGDHRMDGRAGTRHSAAQSPRRAVARPKHCR